MQRIVTLRTKPLEELARLGLIAIGTKTSTRIAGTKKWRIVTEVIFRGNKWRVEYDSTHRIEPYVPQCVGPCDMLGCEAILYTIQ